MPNAHQPHVTYEMLILRCGCLAACCRSRLHSLKLKEVVLEKLLYLGSGQFHYWNTYLLQEEVYVLKKVLLKPM